MSAPLYLRSTRESRMRLQGEGGSKGTEGKGSEEGLGLYPGSLFEFIFA